LIVFSQCNEEDQSVAGLFVIELNPMLADARDVTAWPMTTKLLLEFPGSSVRLVSELCVGRYGPVYHAELLADPVAGSRACRPVAAKTLSASASPDMVRVAR